MGIITIAIFTDPDKGAPHTLAADMAINLGPPVSSDGSPAGYINIPLVVKVAKEAGADAIHPGYGFLSERPEFAAAVVEAGLIFIGPTAEMISSMGSKIGAKVLLKTRAAAVPFVPGYFPMPGEAKPTPAELAEKAKQIRFPLLVKAAAGGGGKGMRVIWNKSDDLMAGIESAMTEARNSFGDDAVMLEEYMQGVKHIEVQILGDQHGNVMHLYERECSVQRRHQKLIEEAPSPFVTPELRDALGTAACSIAKCLNYCNAGTVEFIVDPRDGKFYFLEVNTRLQVEHAVTECVTGIDLVRAQIHVASGKLLADAVRLSMRNGALTIPKQPVGYSVEVRVYSENDEFQPCIGTVVHWDEEQGVAGVDYHTTVRNGSVISVFYDGLLTKVITYATESRDAAFNKLVRALRSLVCLGLQNNKRSLIHLLNHPIVRQGSMCTDFIDKSLDKKTLTLPLPYNLSPTHNSTVLDSLTKASMFASLFLSFARCRARRQWCAIPAGFRSAKKEPLLQRLEYRGNVLSVTYTAFSSAQTLPIKYTVQKGGITNSASHPLDVTLLRYCPVSHVTMFELLGVQEKCVCMFSEPSNQVLVHIGCTGEDYDFIVLQKFDEKTPTTIGPTIGQRSETDASGGFIAKAQMPAKVLKVLKATGDKVGAGEVVVSLESMKMESKVAAPVSGTVTLSVKQGDLIQGGKILFTVTPEKKAD